MDARQPVRLRLAGTLTLQRRDGGVDTIDLAGEKPLAEALPAPAEPSPPPEPADADHR